MPTRSDINNPKYYSAEYWRMQIEDAIKWREVSADTNGWSRIKSCYEHKFIGNKSPNFNLIYTMGSALIPNIIFDDPHIINTPKTPEFNYWIPLADWLDNHFVQAMELKSIIEEAVLNAFLFNLVGLQIGWDFPDEDNENSTRFNEVRFSRVETSSDRQRKENLPWLDLLPAYKMILSRGTKNERNCRWFAKEVIMPIRVLKKRKNINKKAIIENIGLKSTQEQKTQPMYFKNEDWGNNPIKQIEPLMKFKEVHDSEEGKWFWINDDGETRHPFLFPPMEDRLQTNGHGLPIEFIIFNKGVNNIWGVPDSIYIETQFEEGNHARREAKIERAMSLLKVFYFADAIKPDDVTSFKESESIPFISIQDQGDKKIGDVLSTFQQSIDPQRYQSMKEYINDAQFLLGQGPNQVGTPTIGRKTATETKIVDERSLSRTSIRRNNVGRIIGRIYSRLNDIAFAHWKSDIFAHVLGIDAALHFVQASPRQLRGLSNQLITRVNVESMAPIY